MLTHSLACRLGSLQLAALFSSSLNLQQQQLQQGRSQRLAPHPSRSSCPREPWLGEVAAGCPSFAGVQCAPPARQLSPSQPLQPSARLLLPSGAALGAHLGLQLGVILGTAGATIDRRTGPRRTGSRPACWLRLTQQSRKPPVPVPVPVGCCCCAGHSQPHTRSCGGGTGPPRVSTLHCKTTWAAAAATGACRQAGRWHAPSTVTAAPGCSLYTCDSH